MKTCWHIRQELAAKTGSGRANGWLVACAECPLFAGEISCWEGKQSGEGFYCCAPVHVTCDFCEIYIEHRRELMEMIHSGEALSAILGTPAQLQPRDETRGQPAAQPPNHVKGDASATMEKLQLNVPDMWADHHVLKVRAALAAINGVHDLIASSAFRMVALSYDPAVVSPGAIMGALDEAGYSVATDGTGVIAETVPVADGKRDPAWNRLGIRQIKTDERDLKTKR